MAAWKPGAWWSGAWAGTAWAKDAVAVAGDAAAAGAAAGNLSATVPRYARPRSDVTAGIWTASSGSDLYAMVDEASADDADYIQATTVGTCEIKLGGVVDPASSAGHVMRFRSPAGYTPSGGVVVTLLQGATQIAQWTINPIAAGTLYERTLSAGEADAITNYEDLRLRFEAVN